MPIQMVCPRDYTLRTKLGHTIHFEAGQPTPVPESAYQEALSKNILPAKNVDNESPAFDMATAEITGTLRDALIFEAIHTLVQRNHSEDFTGGGMPKPASLSQATGIMVASNEASNYWGRYKQIIAENSELPTHPNVELVRELQSLSTRKQLEAFAKDIGVAVPQTKGKSLAEVKAQLLYNVVNQNQAPIVEEGGYTKPESLEMD